MNNGEIKALLLLLTVGVGGIFHCASPGGAYDLFKTAGGTQDVTTIRGIIYEPDGRPARNASVVIRSSDYLPEISGLGKRGARKGFFSRTSTTDGNGHFAFTAADSIPKGLFIMEARDCNGNRCLLGNTAIDSILYFSPRDSMHLKALNDTLKPPAVIKGTIMTPINSGREIIAVYGLNQWTEAAPDGEFILPNLPEGRLRIILITVQNGVTYDTVPVRTKSGNWTTVDTVVSSRLHVFYNGNGNTAGSVPKDEKEYAANAEITVLGNIGNLVKTGFTFLGWNSEKDGKGTTFPANTAFLMGTGNLTLYAKWNPPAGMKRIAAKDASFQMGDDYGNSDEKPVHQVTFTADFWMDTTEVTQFDYDLLMTKAYGSYRKPIWDDYAGIGANWPAYNVNWYEAVLFCNARTRATGSEDTVYSYTKIQGTTQENGFVDDLVGLTIDFNKGGFRLPTEAQWEYACRGGTTTSFYWGKNYDPYPSTEEDLHEVDRYAVWCKITYPKGCGEDYQKPVATKLMNPFGLYDISGNLGEWCNDWYGSYGSDAAIDPSGPEEGLYRVIRGGEMAYSIVDGLRSAYRDHDGPVSATRIVGFRVLLPAK
jgi:uncharacterized repeat protein (TIGR02543 family)